MVQEAGAAPGHLIRGLKHEHSGCRTWGRAGRKLIWELLGQRRGRLGSTGKGRKEGACWPLCAAPQAEGTTGLTFPYDGVHNQPGRVELLGEVQGSLGRVLICLEVHVRLQPQLVLCGENREGSAQLQGSGVLGGGGGRGRQTPVLILLFPEESCPG